MRKKDFISALEESLKKIGEIKTKSFIEHFVERAYAEDAVAIALAKKILPDLSHSTDETKVKVMQLIIDSKDIPKGVNKGCIGSLTTEKKDEGNSPAVPD